MRSSSSSSSSSSSLKSDQLWPAAEVSVTGWLDFLFHIWPFTAMSLFLMAINFAKNVNILPNHINPPKWH